MAVRFSSGWGEALFHFWSHPECVLCWRFSYPASLWYLLFRMPPDYFFLPEFWFLVNKLYEIFISFKKCFLSFPCQLNSWGHPFSQGKVLISASSVSFWVGKLGCGISLTDASFRWFFLHTRGKISVHLSFMPFACVNLYPSQLFARARTCTGSEELVEHVSFHHLYSVISCL